MKELVFKGENNQALTNSLLVAEKFGKAHQHVLRDIRNLIEGMSKIGDTPMFVETTYIHPQNGQAYPMFVMNRDGFTLLSMGFTGEKALGFKLDYIAAFNKMESIIKTGGFQVPTSFKEALLLAAKQQEQIEEQQKQIETASKKVSSLKEENQYKQDVISGLTEDIPLADMRQRINQIVTKRGVANIRESWRTLYREFDRKYHIDVMRRINNCQYSGNRVDYIEKELNMLPEFYDLTCKLFESTYEQLMEDWGRFANRSRVTKKTLAPKL